MKSEDTPLHHVPSVQGMHQATNVTSDAWEAFFSACLEKYDELILRRQMKQQGETHQSDEPEAEAASPLICGTTEGTAHD